MHPPILRDTSDGYQDLSLFKVNILVIFLKPPLAPSFRLFPLDSKPLLTVVVLLIPSTLLRLSTDSESSPSALLLAIFPAFLLSRSAFLVSRTFFKIESDLSRSEEEEKNAARPTQIDSPCMGLS